MFVLIGAGLVLSGCATSPRETVLTLDSTDRKWTSKRCVEARKEAARFDENKEGHAVIKIVGNLIVPFAGTATSFAMNRLRDDEREELNRKMRAACISDPLGEKPRVATR
ncbi:hypothetical protein LRS10_08520 [Phenylobacterium sp. J426]|uniref:hypothetical protein n=1 Tax=Phenylobacterium sp. J426 TaxID=2898439 RepID=UPI0021513878|nr:hypothetical protein [Phenylobacterium sp. J426]MCR5874201.1 hypothetical protein [Phenylobacterium sp. J426]